MWSKTQLQEAEAWYASVAKVAQVFDINKAELIETWLKNVYSR